MAALSTDIVIKALDSLLLRSAIAAENIANVGTAGYRPARVSFESALKTAALGGEASVQAFVPSVERAAEGSEGVRLDMEIATATGASGRYGALAEVLHRQLQIHGLATGRGR